MNLRSSENAVWYRAAMLLERLSSELAADKAELTEDELARYRLQSWKAQKPFDDPACFERRLALDNLTEQQLRQALSEPVEALRARFPQPPAWLVELGAAFAQPRVTDFHQLIPKRIQKQPAVGFLHVAAPFIAQALARFDAGIAALTADASPLPFDPSTVKKILFALLPETLLNMLNRTLALELNIARLSGELTGETPKERFQSFITRLSEPDCARSLLAEYPALARLLSEQAQRWVTVSLEFLERLCRDWPEISAAFAPESDPGVLISVKGGLADSHRGGRSVLIAKFASGLRIVYKPKSLAVDLHFQELLEWLNARGAAPSFPTLKVINRGSYGWVECAVARDCQTTAEICRFYRRQGGYLALLYLLDATDFHADNLIASGEFPFLIDLEALFHPRRRSSLTDSADPAEKVASRALSHSVMRIGLLPERVWGNDDQVGVDRSGLGTIDHQLTPHALPQWEGAGTDTMRLRRRRKLVKAGKNRPRLKGAGVDVRDYQQEILDGFAATYALLLAHKNELSSDDGPLSRFADDEVCVFLRSMRTYRRLLRESYHPDCLRDGLDRDRLFDLLWIEVEDDQDLARVIRVERDDLSRGDIPLFTTRPHSRDLWIRSDECITDFFPVPSLAVVRQRVGQLGQEDLERQAWLIQAALATMGETARPQGAQLQVPPPPSQASAGRLLTAAQNVGDRLQTLALRGQDDASWIGLTQERDRFWSIAPCGLDLDSGLPGVTLFLAYLGAVTKAEKYTALAQSSLIALQRQVRERWDDMGLIGAFDGWGGVIYTLTHLGALWRRRDLFAEAEAIADRLPALITEDDVLDLYGGAAGCIGALHCLAQYVPSDLVSLAAIQCGDHLLAQAQKMPEGIGWLPLHGAQIPLTGFAHGAAGIACALLRLHAWSGLERFRSAAHKAMRYERSCFSAADSQPGFRTAWCHGATGIGLARLSSLAHADDTAIRAEIETALTATLRHGFGHNHSLCHGDAGSLELLLLAAHTVADFQWKDHLQRRMAALLESIEQYGFLCGTPYAVETPGLLTGLSGIGYQLLRLAEPEFVPSALTLEPPKKSHSSD
jgi:type 2 lantibiotic biosynthesis protein LanM